MKIPAVYLLFTILYLLIISPCSAQFITWHWSITEGAELNEYITAVDTDAEGNIYVTGAFKGTVDFFGEMIISSGSSDVFVARFDPSGNMMWVRQGGGTYEDGPKDIYVYDQFVYVTGGFQEQADFEGHTLVSAGARDMFLLKYDLNGNFQWAVRGGSVTDDIGNSVTADADGSIYLTGDINYAATFGDKTVEYFGFTDLFIAKYNGEGQCDWAKSAGGSIYDYGGFIETVDGHLFVSGAFNDVAHFDTATVTSVDFVDVFIAHYLTDGSLVEVISAGGTNNENIGCMAVDSELNVYVGGWYMLDILIGDQNFTSNGGMDIFIAKYEPGTGFVWANSYGGIGIDEAQAMSIGWIADGKDWEEDTFIIAGTFENEVSFQEHTLISQGFADGFILQQNFDGNIDWATQIGGGGTLKINDCIVRDPGDCIFVGDFVEELTIGNKTYNTVGGYDLFMANLGHSNSINEDNFISGLEIQPNPANQNLLVKYTLKDNSQVSFKITDITGRVVTQVHDTYKLRGTHQQEFNTSELKQGNYLLLISTEKSTATKKIIKL